MLIHAQRAQRARWGNMRILLTNHQQALLRASWTIHQQANVTMSTVNGSVQLVVACASAHPVYHLVVPLLFPSPMLVRSLQPTSTCLNIWRSQWSEHQHWHRRMRQRQLLDSPMRQHMPSQQARPFDRSMPINNNKNTRKIGNNMINRMHNTIYATCRQA